MRTIRQKKMLYIGALVAIIGSLSIGFALFSSNLTIRSNTTVTSSEDNLNIVLSASSTDINVTTIKPTNYSSGNNTTATNAIITKEGKNYTISGIKLGFNEKTWHIIDYYIYAHNKGKIKTYWKSQIKNIEGTESKVRCTAREGTRDDLVQEMCKNFSIKVLAKPSNQGAFNPESHQNGEININDYYVFLPRIEYEANENDPIADGPFDIEFGDIEISFSSAPFN